MKLYEIDKSIYRQRLNYVIIGFIAILTLLSLGFGAGLIALFSEPVISLNNALVDTEQPNNFKYNLLGVVLALLTCAITLHHLKTKTFFNEIYYVWQLKQLHNFIYRKLKSIKNAAFEQNDARAMLIMTFYYTSLKQVYLLDDNTLTIASLEKSHQQLNDHLSVNNISINIEHFDKSMLACY